jgi:hypothetical protein
MHYWLAWCLILLCDLFTKTQTEYHFWLLSPYAWWIAPFVLWYASPQIRRPHEVSILIPIVIITWAMWHSLDLTFEAISSWQFAPIDSPLKLLGFPSKALLAGLIVSTAYARLLVKIFGQFAVSVALTIGFPVVSTFFYTEILDFSKWYISPIRTLISITSAALIVQLLVFGTRRFQAAADLRVKITDPQKKVTSPRIAGFFSVVLITLGILVFGNHVEITLDEPSINVVVAITSWTIAIALVTHSGTRAWRRLRNFGLVTHPLHKATNMLGRCGVALVTGLFWVKLVWSVAPQTGQQLIDLADTSTQSSWAMRVTHSGKILSISGGFKRGIASAFMTNLRTHPTIRIVELNSPGGLSSEGQRIAEAVRANKLIVLVRGECSSACASTFAAGQERWIEKGSNLGLHTSSWLRLPGGYAVEEKAELQQEGIPESLAKHAALVPFWDIWFPKEKELLDSGMITKVLTADEIEKAISETRPET